MYIYIGVRAHTLAMSILEVTLSIVIPGIGKFVIVDNSTVAEEDLGNK